MIHVVWGVVLACGKEEQFSPEIVTPFISLEGKPLLAHALAVFEQCPEVSGAIVVSDKSRIQSVQGMVQMFGLSKVQKVVAGFSSRQSSVDAALNALDDEVSIVVIHDGARPFLKPLILGEVIKSAKRYGSGVAAVPLRDSVKVTRKGQTACKTAKGDQLWMAQTPQAFRRDLLQKGFAAAARKKVTLPDESSALELIGEEVRLVESVASNIRIRTPADFALAMAILKT